jgi:hypothetical protein
MSSVVSETRGRLRLRLDGGLPRARWRRIEASLHELRGVRLVHASPPIRSMAVYFDPALLSARQVLDRLESEGLSVEQPPGAPVAYAGTSTVSRALIDNLGQADRAVARFSGGTADLKLLIPFMLLALGAFRSLFRGLQLTAVPAYLLLWYAFDTFYKLHTLRTGVPAKNEPKTD